MAGIQKKGATVRSPLAAGAKNVEGGLRAHELCFLAASLPACCLRASAGFARQGLLLPPQVKPTPMFPT